MEREKDAISNSSTLVRTWPQRLEWQKGGNQRVKWWNLPGDWQREKETVSTYSLLSDPSFTPPSPSLPHSLCLSFSAAHTHCSHTALACGSHIAYSMLGKYTIDTIEAEHEDAHIRSPHTVLWQIVCVCLDAVVGLPAGVAGCQVSCGWPGLLTAATQTSPASVPHSPPPLALELSQRGQEWTCYKLQRFYQKPQGCSFSCVCRWGQKLKLLVFKRRPRISHLTNWLVMKIFIGYNPCMQPHCL